MCNNSFIWELLGMFEEFLKEQGKDKYCILLTTSSGIIKGNLVNLQNIDPLPKPKPVKLKTYLDNLDNFIHFFNFHAKIAREKIFSDVSDDVPHKYNIIENISMINMRDIVVIQNAVIYSNNTKFKLKSHMVMSSSISGISIVPKDYEPSI